MDVVDSFVVSLGLDPRQYNDEIKKYRDDRKRLGEENVKYNREQEQGQKRLVEGIRGLRNETAGFLFMLAGANGVKSFTADLVGQDAATGRLAKNIGVATESLSAWQGALKTVGGTAADADAALRTMAGAFQSLQLLGTTGHDADFQGLGVNARDLQNPETALLKIAEASQRMSRPEFTARASRLGLDPATITLLSRGRAGVEQLIEAQRRLGVVTEQDAAKAAEFEKNLANIETTIRNKLRPSVYEMIGGFSEWISKSENLNTVLAVGGGILVVIAAAAAVAYAPFIALAGAIALVATNMEKLKSTWHSFEGWWKGVQDDFNNIPGIDHLRSLLGVDTKAEHDAKQGRAGSIADPLASPVGGISSAIGAGAARSGAGSASRAEQFWRANGFTANQARGIVGAMTAENGSLDPSAFNPAGGGQGAYGLGQWRGARLRALRAKYGQNPTFDQQLEFMLHEIRNGDAGGGAAAGPHIGGSSAGAARGMIDRFYRPGSGAAGDYARAGRYIGQPGAIGARGAASGGGGNQSTSIGQIVIYSAATDAEGIAHDMRGALAKRGLVVQANTGLQP